MMIQRVVQVQTAVYAALAAALAPLPVSTAPSGATRYVRIDGFSGANDDSYKNAESSTHRFTVNAFDAPEGGTKSLAWVWATLATIDGALSGLAIADSRIVAEDTLAWFDPKATEGVFNAQGYVRYRVQLGA